MTRISITNNRILHDGRDYGPSSALLCYPGEEKGLGELASVPEAMLGRAGTVVCSTPHNIDLVASVGMRVLGCEVKRMPDFVDSWFSRRLHRQLRTLLATVDLPVLVVRDFSWDELHALFLERNRHQRRKRGFNEIMEDIVNLQSQGVYWFPVAEDEYRMDIAALRRALAGPGTRILAGTDQAARDRKPGWLLRKIPGIGPAKSAELVKDHGEPTDVLIAARNGDIPGAIGKKLIEAGRE